MTFGRATLLLVLVLAPSWWRFPVVWGESREHGFIIGLLCGWLVWRNRAVLTQPGPGNGAAMAALGLTSVAWWAAITAGLQVVHLLLTPALLTLWVAATRSESAVRAVVPIAATFLLAIPLWEALIPLLQSLTVLASQLVLGAVSIKAQIKDTLIILPSGVLEVADSCSGLNFLMVGTSIGVVHAHLFLRHWPNRLRGIALAAALSVLANWVRVIGLVFIADATRMKSSLMQDHEVYGWGIFVAAIASFFWLVRPIERRDTNEPVTPDHADMAFESQDGRHATQLTLPFVSSIVGPALLLLLQLLPAEPEPVVFEAGTNPGPQWTRTTDSPAVRWVPEFDGASSRVRRAFTNGGAYVLMERVSYTRLRNGRELTGGANRIEGKGTVLDSRNVGPLDQRLRQVRQTVVRTDSGAILLWSWYRVAGVDTPSPLKAKLLQLVAAFTRQHLAEAVMVATPCTGKSCESAARTMFEFVTGRAPQ